MVPNFNLNYVLRKSEYVILHDLTSEAVAQEEVEQVVCGSTF